MDILKYEIADTNPLNEKIDTETVIEKKSFG